MEEEEILNKAKIAVDRLIADIYGEDFKTKEITLSDKDLPVVLSKENQALLYDLKRFLDKGISSVKERIKEELYEDIRNLVHEEIRSQMAKNKLNPSQ